MNRNVEIHFGWIKFMYIYNAFTAGILGLGIILFPQRLISLFKIPNQEPIVFGIIGSVYFSLGILSLLGLMSPIKFVPILLLQLFYKLVWIIGVILPLLITGQLSIFAILLTLIFTTYIIGDIIAIPFSYIFLRQRSLD